MQGNMFVMFPFYFIIGGDMKIDVEAKEKDIYLKYCEKFSANLEKKMNAYITISEFLKSVEVEDILSIETSNVYKKYKDFCEKNNMKPLDITPFSMKVCNYGLEVCRTSKNGQKYSFYKMR